MSSDSHTESRYRIGAVARLTGVAVETLRVWERRYSAVEPLRTEGGSRLYSELDITRLTLIKRLVDAGHAIGTVANLTLEQLEERCGTARSARPGRTPDTPATISIIGSTLPTRLRAGLGETTLKSLRLGETFANIAAFEKLAKETRCDGLVIEVRRLQRYCPPGRIVVVYGYGKRESIEHLESQGVVTQTYPTSWPELQRVFAADARPSPAYEVETDAAGMLAGPIPPRRFSDRQLATIASASSSVYCECPNHLVDLVLLCDVTKVTTDLDRDWCVS